MSKNPWCYTDTCLTMNWNTVWSMYQELYDEEVVVIRARIEAEDAEDEAKAEAADGEKDETSQVAETLEADPAKLPPSS